MTDGAAEAADVDAAGAVVPLDCIPPGCLNAANLAAIFALAAAIASTAACRYT